MDERYSRLVRGCRSPFYLSFRILLREAVIRWTRSETMGAYIVIVVGLLLMPLVWLISDYDESKLR
jgi:hypothetical protein